MEDIFDVINELVDLNVDAAEQKLKELGDVRVYDECIDDGCDDGEDTYVMKRCLELKVGDEEFRVRMYYGNQTRLVGYVDIN